MRDVIEARQAKENQELLQAESEQKRGINGLGRLKMTIDSSQYHGWARRFGTYDCWRDSDFKRYWLNKNPEGKATGFGGTRTQIQCGFESAPRRFHKTYEDNSV